MNMRVTRGVCCAVAIATVASHIACGRKEKEAEPVTPVQVVGPLVTPNVNGLLVLNAPPCPTTRT